MTVVSRNNIISHNCESLKEKYNFSIMYYDHAASKL